MHPESAGDVPSLEALEVQAVQVKHAYDEMNQLQRGRTWTREEFMLGFVGDVGDLAKLVMAQEGAREVPGGREALGHELADCFWSVLILAHLYEIDLAAEFQRTMAGISNRIQSIVSEQITAT